MTALDHDLPITRVTARPGAMVRAWAAFCSFMRIWHNRRVFNRLNEFTESELADIGLTPDDLRTVAQSPFHIDPTSRLSALARARLLSQEEAARRIH